MHTVDLLEEALGLVERVGYRVRQEWLDGGGGGGCTPEWVCDGWSNCTPSGWKLRTCSDTKDCNKLTGKPTEAERCTYEWPEVEEKEEEAKKRGPRGGYGDEDQSNFNCVTN